MNVTYATITHWQQSEQTGGFWLVTIHVQANQLFDVGGQFHLPTSAATLALFQQTQKGGQLQLQFLSQSPIAADCDLMTLHYTPPEIITPSPPVTSNLLLIGSGLSMASVFYFAKQRSLEKHRGKTLALLHSADTFPFTIKPARFMVPNMPTEAIGACPLIEDWQIGNRLASDLGLVGCFEGSISDLLADWCLAENQTQMHDPQVWQLILSVDSQQKQRIQALCQTYSWLQVAITVSHG